MPKSNEIEDFAIALAREFSTACPVTEGAQKPATIKQVAQAIDVVCGRAAQFQQQKRLGMLGRARMGTAFKLHLKEAGYPEGFVDEVTRRLLMVMSAT